MTYSIVARDAETGDLGVGVQSRSFGTGSAVPWVEPGAGAVATQAFTERSYGPLGLRLMRAGKTPGQALAGLVAADPDADDRQVALVDVEGRAAAHTGTRCIADAGHLVGDGFSVQANMCRGAVWEAMAEAYTEARGTLARRLLAALHAAEEAGGDFRGRQAGGILVRPAGGRPWERVCDVRVDDHPEPLAELERLLTLEEGYRAANRAHGTRAREAQAAGLPELDRRWAEIHDRADAGDLDGARALLAPLAADEPRWLGYVRALERRGLLPGGLAGPGE